MAARGGARSRVNSNTIDADDCVELRRTLGGYTVHVRVDGVRIVYGPFPGIRQAADVADDLRADLSPLAAG